MYGYRLEKGKDNNNKRKEILVLLILKEQKSIKQMKLAEKFNRPVIMFVDTPGVSAV